MSSLGHHTVICGEPLILLPDRAIFWPAQKMLLVADLHMGKAVHFRKNGLAVPHMVEKNNLWRLSGLIQMWKPEQLVFLGDLFHSIENNAWSVFKDFLANYGQMHHILIKGNHDILPVTHFAEAGLLLVDELEKAPFLLSHDRVESGSYNLHGHIHPSVYLSGKGRQRIKLPCFYFSESCGILPSFGDFTGSFPLRPKITERVFVVTEGAIFEM